MDPTVAVTEGVSKLYEWGGLVTVLVLITILMGFYIRKLSDRNDELVNRILTVIESNTSIMTQFTGKIDAVLRSKD